MILYPTPTTFWIKEVIHIVIVMLQLRAKVISVMFVA